MQRAPPLPVYVQHGPGPLLDDDRFGDGARAFHFIPVC